MSDTIEQFGFTAVPRSLDKLIATHSTKATSTPVSVDDIDLPTTPLVASITALVKEKLPRQTYNHSMRVYYYGKTIALIYRCHVRKLTQITQAAPS